MGVAGLGKPLRLIVRELTRNRRRTGLTFAGLVISFFLYTALESILYTMTSVLSSTASDTVIFVRPRDRTSFWQPQLPRAYATQIADMEGVVGASPIRFYVGRGREEGSFAAALGVEADSYFTVRPLRGVSDAELAAFRASRTAGIVGARLLTAQEWRLGSEVTIRGAGRAPSLSFEAVGDIALEDRFAGLAVVHLDYLEDVLRDEGRVTFIQARVGDASQAGALARRIDAHFRNFSVPTETITEKAHVATFVGSLAGALGALRVIATLALLVTILVVGNTVAMSVRERTVEIGTLRALGYGRGRVLGLVLGESMLVSLAGGVVGASIAYAMFELGLVKLPAEFRLQFVTDWTLLARSALLALPVGALAAARPAWSAVRMSITDALRYAD